MNWKKSALLALVVASMGMLVGCETEVVTPVDVDGDGETRTYVLSTANIPMSDSVNGVGFDLDGVNSTGATEACDDAPDVTSSLSGATGVDNSLGSLAGTLDGLIGDGGIEGAVQEQISSGTFLLLMEVSDIDNDTTDGMVGVRLFLGTTTETIELAGGLIAPGQTFTEGEVLVTIPRSGAAITAGAVAFVSPTLPISLSVSGTNVSLPLTNAHFRAVIGAGVLTDGEIGAQVALDDVVRLAMDLGQDFTRETISAIVPPDLDPDPTDNTVCDAISVGLTFSAVSANP